jgi:hypothetical protein
MLWIFPSLTESDLPWLIVTWVLIWALILLLYTLGFRGSEEITMHRVPWCSVVFHKVPFRSELVPRGLHTPAVSGSLISSYSASKNSSKWPCYYSPQLSILVALASSKMVLNLTLWIHLPLQSLSWHLPFDFVLWCIEEKLLIFCWLAFGFFVCVFYFCFVCLFMLFR